MKKKSFKPGAKRVEPLRVFPLYSIILFTVALLVTASFWDYHPHQSEWIDTAVHLPGVKKNIVGNFGVFISFWSNYLVGIVSWLFPVFLFWNSYALMFRKSHLLNVWRFLAMSLAIMSGAAIMDLAYTQFHLTGHLADVNYFPNGLGGCIGCLIFTKFFASNLGIFGSTLIFLITYGVSFTLSLSSSRNLNEALDRFTHGILPSIQKLPFFLKALFARFFFKLRKHPQFLSERLDQIYEEEEDDEEPVKHVEKHVPLKRSVKLPSPKAKKPVPASAPKNPEQLIIFTSESAEKATITIPQVKGNYVFPSRSLLKTPPKTSAITEEDHQQIADSLVQTLDEFGIKVTPSEVHTGPVITRYEVTPAPGVRVEKILNLSKNIALSLKAHSIRILAPVPGKGSVGIEIPNQVASPVCLREIIESRAWVDSKAEIPIVLGKAVTGKPLVFDLTKMPHLLIAGSTGSGKTVCINAIVASLLYYASPQDVRFIMVDPKIVEMQGYNELPHMLIPVVTEAKKVPSALKWLISEMERRYQIFAQSNVRNITGFNAKVMKYKKESEHACAMDAEMLLEERTVMSNIEVPCADSLAIPEDKLPYIVCVIDELADLMMVAPADIETCIARLAQLARAAGIHFIIATQRPSVNVITGVIKANLPCRISFKVASKVDSRTIIDGGGADQLIGRGDMLFVPPGASDLMRVQGAFVSDEEINCIVEAVKSNGPPKYSDEVQRQIEAENGEEEDNNVQGDWSDDLVPNAIAVIRATKRASTSMLQRRLNIGYNRAARIMELLEAEGYVGPENGVKPREILTNLEVL